jgi:hypothetical protein
MTQLDAMSNRLRPRIWMLAWPVSAQRDSTFPDTRVT